MYKFNNVLLSKKNLFVVSSNSTSEQADYSNVLAFMNDVAQLGYTFDKTLLTALFQCSNSELLNIREEMVSLLKSLVGAHVKYVPLFKNFPYEPLDLFRNKVMSAIQNIFSLNIEHYTVLNCGHAIDHSLFDLHKYNYCPLCESEKIQLVESDAIFDYKKVTPFKVISLGTEKDTFTLFKNLLSSKSSISESDKEFITDLVVSLGDSVLAYLPEQIHMKEQLALISGLLIQYTSLSEKTLPKYFKTATDVLRLAIQLSGGDVSLATHSKIKLSNKHRRLIMTLLENIHSPLEDMKRHRQYFIALGEVLHVRQFENKFPLIATAFSILRNDHKSIKTFNSNISGLIETLSFSKGKSTINEIQPVVNLLSSRAGEFGRRVDFLLRVSDVQAQEYVLSVFDTIAHELPTAMLLTIESTIKNRIEPSEYRAFLPKGSVAKIFRIEDQRLTISSKVVQQVSHIVEKTLIERFSKLESLGHTYIDPNLVNILLPLSQRSASTASKIVSRGSRVKISDKTKVIRLFQYWKHYCDLDLTANFYNENLDFMQTISYWNREDKFSKHSGDIRNGSQGAAEFIDVDIELALKAGIRYLIAFSNVYSGQSYNEINSFVGFMERDSMTSGKHFEASAVNMKIDMVSEHNSGCPFIFDLETKEFILADMSLGSLPTCSNAHSSGKSIHNNLQYVIDLYKHRPLLSRLVELHAKARATSISYNKEDTFDTYFDYDFSTNVDVILSKFL